MVTESENINIPLVFRDYVVLLATSQATNNIYRDMIKPLGLLKVVNVHKGQKVLGAAKHLSPDLVVASTDMQIFSGPQILSAARQDPLLADLPFLIVGAKEDTKPGGLADSVCQNGKAAFVGLPCSANDFCQAAVDLMTPLVNQDHEGALQLMDLAAKSIKGKDLQTAVGLLARASSLYPDHLGIMLSLAAVHADMENFNDAEEAYLGALELDPYSMLAYFGLAELYERRGDYEHTVGVLTQALGLAQMLKASDKSISRINFFIGEFELRLERLLRASELFDSAINLNPEDALLRSDIGDSYMEKDYLEECEEHYQASLEIDPNQAHIFNRLGIAYRKQKKYDKALQLYDNARSYHPQDEHLLFNAARAHLEANRNLEAAALLEQALEKSPKFRAASQLLKLAEEGKTWTKFDRERLLEEDSAKLWNRDTN